MKQIHSKHCKSLTELAQMSIKQGRRIRLKSGPAKLTELYNWLDIKEYCSIEFLYVGKVVQS